MEEKNEIIDKKNITLSNYLILYILEFIKIPFDNRIPLLFLSNNHKDFIKKKKSFQKVSNFLDTCKFLNTLKKNNFYFILNKEYSKKYHNSEEFRKTVSDRIDPKYILRYSDNTNPEIEKEIYDQIYKKYSKCIESTKESIKEFNDLLKKVKGELLKKKIKDHLNDFEKNIIEYYDIINSKCKKELNIYKKNIKYYLKNYFNEKIILITKIRPGQSHMVQLRNTYKEVLIFMKLENTPVRKVSKHQLMYVISNFIRKQRDEIYVRGGIYRLVGDLKILFDFIKKQMIFRGDLKNPEDFPEYFKYVEIIKYLKYCFEL